MPHGNLDMEKSSGNVRFTQSDFEISNAQFEYGMERTYNSQAEYNSMTGYGFMDSYHMEILRCGEDLILLESDGSCLRFTKENEEYVCSETKEYSCEEKETGYEIKAKDDVTYEFNEFGQLVKRTEPNGCEIQNTYDSSGRLLTVTSNTKDTNSRMLLFTYEGSDFGVKSITDFEGTTYEYVRENGKLTQVRASKGSESVIYENEYSQEGNLTCASDAEGNRYEIFYEGEKVESVSYPNGEALEFTYSENGKTAVTKKTAAGDTVYVQETVTDEEGKLMSFKDEKGRVSNYTYSGYLLETASVPAGYQSISDKNVSNEEYVITTTYTYDEKGNLKCEESSDGKTAVYDYYEDDRLKTETVKEGEAVISNTEYEYDNYGNVETVKDSVAGTKEYYEYNEDGAEEKAVVTDDEIKVSESETSYDSFGNETENTEKSGVLQTKENTVYDNMGRITEQRDETSVTYFEYDFLGREVKRTVKEEGKADKVTVSVYNKNGSLLSESTSPGITSEYSYDSLNRVTENSVKGSDIITRSETTEYGYEKDVKINQGYGTRTESILYTKTLKDEGGAAVSKTYTDISGNIIRTLEGDCYEDTTFDASGNAYITVNGKLGSEDREISLSLTDTDGNSFAQIRNPAVTENGFKEGEDSVSLYTVYDEKGNVVEETDGNGNTTRFSYDGEGRITSCDLLGDEEADLTVTYTVNEEEGLTTTTVTDANGNIKKEVTNEAGLLVRTEDISKNSSDGSENLFTEYSYDSLGRVTKEAYQGGSFTEISYEGESERIKSKSFYKSEGNLESSENYEYNDLGEMTKVTVTGSGGEIIFEGSFTYDCEGKILSEKSNILSGDEKEVTYSYDSRGRISGKSYPTDSGIGNTGFVYDLYGRLLKVTKNGEEIRSCSYDSLNRILSVTEKVGNRNLTKNYSYDSLGRTALIFYSEGTEVLQSFAYEYDKNDNITKFSHVNSLLFDGEKINEETVYSYDEKGNLTESAKTDKTNEESNTVTAQYFYDSVGNRTKAITDGKETLYTYNGLNQLVSSESEGLETEYLYDKRGNEVLKTVTRGDEVISTIESEYSVSGNMTKRSLTEDGQTLIQENLYNHNGQRIQKEENEVAKKYYYDQGTLYMAETDTVEESTGYILGSESTAIGMVNQGQQYLYLKDIQGSTRSIVSEEGLDAAYGYSDFGETEEISESAANNEICYTGAVYDESTGLYYMNARYYSPEDGRFISQDTYRGEKNNPGQWHLYTYCANNPINYVDPSGHDAIVLKSNFISNYIGHMAVLVEGVGGWKYFSWARKGWKSEYMDKNANKVVKGTVVKKEINDLFHRESYSKKYRKYIYLKGDFIGSSEYIKKVKKGQSYKKYILTSLNCAWMAIEVLKYGRLSKKQYNNLNDLQWRYVKSSRENAYVKQMKTIIPNTTLSIIANIFNTKIKNIKGV